MSEPTLRDLLHALLADAPSADAVVRAREALAAHPLGEGLALDALFVHDVAGDAVDLLAVLDEARDEGLAEALAEAGGSVDVADGVMAALFGAAASPVADAVDAEAGRPGDLGRAHDPAALPVAEAVAAEAGRGPELAKAHDPEALPLAEALAAEAGTAALVEPVMARLGEEVPELPEGWASAFFDARLPDGLRVRAAERLATDADARAEIAAFAEVGRLLREAVPAEAGAAPAVWPAVADAVGADVEPRVEGWDEGLLGRAVAAEAGEAAIVDRVMATVERGAQAPTPLPLPEPANVGGWSGLGLVLAAAAAALLVAVLPRVLGGADPGDPWTPRPLSEFATADELTVDRVQYGERASVFVEVPETQGAPVLIWVDDGADL